MNLISYYILEGALALMIFLLIPCLYRVFVGPAPADRLQAVELTTSLLIGIIILLALIQKSSLVLDIGIALAAFGFIASLALARYLSEGRIL